jgi:hypothetical protein
VFEIVLLIDIYYYSTLDIESSATRIAMTAIAMLLFLIFTFMRYYIPLMIVTFKLSWKQIYKNALIFAFAGMLPNLLISLVVGWFYFLVVASIYTANFPLLALLLITYVLFFPSFRALLIQFCIFPKVKKHMIDPYYKEHPEEDHEQRHALNIPDEYIEQKAKEEAVFVDRGRTDSYAEPEEKKEDLPPIPKQYSEREMRRFRESQRRARGEDADDDGTI